MGFCSDIRGRTDRYTSIKYSGTIRTGLWVVSIKRIPDQELATAWQRESGTGAGKDFLVLFGNSRNRKSIICINLFIKSYLET